MTKMTFLKSIDRDVTSVQNCNYDTSTDQTPHVCYLYTGRVNNFDNSRGRCSGHSILEIPWDIIKLLKKLKKRSLDFITLASAQTSSGENTDVLALSEKVRGPIRLSS